MYNTRQKKEKQIGKTMKDMRFGFETRQSGFVPQSKTGALGYETPTPQGVLSSGSAGIHLTAQSAPPSLPKTIIDDTNGYAAPQQDFGEQQGYNHPGTTRHPSIEGNYIPQNYIQTQQQNYMQQLQANYAMQQNYAQNLAAQQQEYMQQQQEYAKWQEAYNKQAYEMSVAAAKQREQERISRERIEAYNRKMAELEKQNKQPAYYEDDDRDEEQIIDLFGHRRGRVKRPLEPMILPSLQKRKVKQLDKVEELLNAWQDAHPNMNSEEDNIRLINKFLESYYSEGNRNMLKSILEEREEVQAALKKRENKRKEEAEKKKAYYKKLPEMQAAVEQIMERMDPKQMAEIWKRIHPEGMKSEDQVVHDLSRSIEILSWVEGEEIDARLRERLMENEELVEEVKKQIVRELRYRNWQKIKDALDEHNKRYPNEDITLEELKAMAENLRYKDDDVYEPLPEVVVPVPEDAVATGQLGEQANIEPTMMSENSDVSATGVSFTGAMLDEIAEMERNIWPDEPVPDKNSVEYAYWVNSYLGSTFLTSEQRRVLDEEYYSGICSERMRPYGASYWGGNTPFPNHAAKITSSFGLRDLNKHENGEGKPTDSHMGIDIGGLPNGTPIESIWYGKVVDVGTRGLRRDAGNYIVVESKDVNGNTVYLYFFHMDRNVKGTREGQYQIGDMISPGMVLGNVGNSGESNGDHLHFEVRTGKHDEGNLFGENDDVNHKSNKTTAVNPSYMLGAFASGTVTADRYARYDMYDYMVPYIPGVTDEAYGSGFGDFSYDTRIEDAERLYV